MNVARWFLGMIVFIFICASILKYGEYSIGIIILISSLALLISLFKNKHKSKNNY